LTHNEIVKALHSLRPGAEWTLSGENYENLNWLSTGSAPTIAEIEAEIALLPAKNKAETDKIAADKNALLIKLGITEDEARLLLS
jgi:hypothetical protein